MEWLKPLHLGVLSVGGREASIPRVKNFWVVFFFRQMNARAERLFIFNVSQKDERYDAM